MASPNFLIIGERRSGTTTLARWIECHPEIFLHPTMDIGYFVDRELVGSRVWKDGPAKYDRWDSEHSKEEYENFFEDATGYKAIGEKSADYLFLEQCHERIKKYYPDIKLVITLRNPVERAWSMYWNEFGKGREKLTFEKAIKAEDERIQKSDYALDHLSYISRGYYAKSIKKLFHHFDPQKVHIVILEDAISNPEKSLKELYEFLGVDTSIGFDNVGKKFNKNWTLLQKHYIVSNPVLSKVENFYYRFLLTFSKIIFRKNVYKRRNLVALLSKPFRLGKEDQKLKEKVRQELQLHFQPLNRELEDLLDIQLDKWS